MGDTALLSAFSLREYVQPYPLKPQSEEQTALSQCERGKKTDVKCEVFSVGGKGEISELGTSQGGRDEFEGLCPESMVGEGTSCKA